MTDPLLALRGLGVAHGGMPALAGIDLDLPRGGRLAVIGESGSGKSTLALAVAGLLPPEARLAGSVSFPALGTAPRLGRDIGVVFQDPAGSLDPVLRVGEQVAEVLVAHRGLSWRAAFRRVDELLAGVRLPGRAARAFPHQLSGGQCQRVALAAALAAEPALLIADELTSALDTVVQRELASLLDELVKARGLTLLFVTHDIGLAANLADDVAVLRRGRLLEHGPVARVLAQPQHPYTQALLATHLDLATPLGARLPEIGPDA